MILDRKCRLCWWIEGGACFNEKIKPVEKKDGWRVGNEITEEHFAKCEEMGGQKGKREVMEELIPGDMLIIVSEENIKQEEKEGEP